MKKTFGIVKNSFPVLLMIGFIPLVPSDYVLTGICIAVILVSFAVKRERNDTIIFVFGFFTMTVFEYLFASTGVETFRRNSLFGLMPLWLPFLWGYGFVAIKRAVKILEG